MKSLLALLALFTMGLQDKPQAIARKDLPKEALCAVCAVSGEEHGKEKPAAGLMYKGVAYYFCSFSETRVFKADPEAYVVPVLPRAVGEFSMSDTTGKLWNTAAMKDKVVMVDYWATWCGPCKAMFPTFERLVAKYKEQPVVLLSISVDQKKSDLDKFLKGHHFPNPVLHDTEGVFAKLGVHTIPATLLIKNGQIIGQWTGKQTEQALDEAISSALER